MTRATIVDPFKFWTLTVEPTDGVLVFVLNQLPRSSRIAQGHPVNTYYHGPVDFWPSQYVRLSHGLGSRR